MACSFAAALSTSPLSVTTPLRVSTSIWYALTVSSAAILVFTLVVIPASVWAHATVMIAAASTAAHLCSITDLLMSCTTPHVQGASRVPGADTAERENDPG